MILLIDNYDSFTYNLYQYFAELGAELMVRRNDEITLDEIADAGFEAVVLSPGPCDPDQAGICLDVIARFSGTVPILGVCLGHQCISQHFGGRIIRVPGGPVHGKSSPVEHAAEGLFAGIPSPFEAGRYHSLVAKHDEIPDVLHVTARTGDIVMAVQHREHPTYGVQFHPESILTDAGRPMLRNFLDLAKTFNQGQAHGN